MTTEITFTKKRIQLVKEAARQSVIKAANRYMETRDRGELAYIQSVCDELDDAFMLMIQQKDGVPVCVTFNPGGDIPNVDSSNSSAEVIA
jgi:hypothetical protein